VINSTKLSLSFSVAVAFLLTIGTGSMVLINRVNHILEDVRFYHLQINQIAEAMTALRLHPANARENLPRIDDLKHLARTSPETKEIVKAGEAIERGAPPSEAIADLERLSEYYRKAAERARQQLVMIHQWAVQGIILLMGGGTVLVVGIMVLVRRWFITPLFDVHEVIQLAIADDPTRPLPKNEMRELVAPVCELAAKVKLLENRATRAERLASAGEACTRVGQNLRNLVHSMRTMAQYERDAQATNPNTRAALDYIIATTNTMDRWVTSLVNTTRPLELKSCRQAVEPIIRDSVSLLNPLLSERSITVEFEPADSLPDVLLDRALFEQALVAVLKNAMDASPDESRIVVTTTCRHDDAVRVTIADEGEGMSEEVRRRACDAFFTSRKDGVGLGLTYVLRIVELHGGKIEIESEPRKGTRVHIELPGAASAVGKPPDAHPKVTVLPSSKSALSASARR
jgi:signal transduction histidine kinase